MQLKGSRCISVLWCPYQCLNLLGLQKWTMVHIYDLTCTLHRWKLLIVHIYDLANMLHWWKLRIVPIYDLANTLHWWKNAYGAHIWFSKWATLLKYSCSPHYDVTNTTGGMTSHGHIHFTKTSIMVCFRILLNYVLVLIIGNIQ